jgi:hypothetical protein
MSNSWKEIFVLCVFCAATAIASPAQTFTVLHSFTDAPDGHFRLPDCSATLQRTTFTAPPKRAGSSPVPVAAELCSS